uniref:RRM domain-containing protein n=1 Tax=Acrobeloides nanus TaxID=290746 RepID=A0A914CZD3_9BILA
MSHSKARYTTKGEGVYSDSEEEFWDRDVQTIGSNKEVSRPDDPNSIEIAVEALDELLDDNELEKKAKKFVKTLGWLPTATEKDFRKFFDDCNQVQSYYQSQIEYKGGKVCLMKYFMEFETEDDVTRALLKHKKHYGEQYINVNLIKKNEMAELMKRMEVNRSFDNAGFIRISGFSSNLTEDKILQFIREVKVEKIILKQKSNRSEAYIKIEREDDVDVIVTKKLLEKIGDNFVTMHRIDGVEFHKMESLKNIQVVKNDQASIKDTKTEQPKLQENINLVQPKSSQLSVKAKIETPKTTFEKNIHTWNNRTLVEPLRDSLQMVQRLVPNYPDSFIIHTHLENTLNYVGMIERELQSYADKLQNLEQMKKDLERQLQITKPDRELDTN